MDKTQMNILIDKDKHMKLKTITNLKQTTITDCINNLIDEYIKENEIQFKELFK